MKNKIKDTSHIDGSIKKVIVTYYGGSKRTFTAIEWMIHGEAVRAMCKSFKIVRKSDYETIKVLALCGIVFIVAALVSYCLNILF